MQRRPGWVERFPALGVQGTKTPSGGWCALPEHEDTSRSPLPSPLKVSRRPVRIMSGCELPVLDSDRIVIKEEVGSSCEHRVRLKSKKESKTCIHGQANFEDVTKN